MNILYQSDDNYAPYLGVSVCSLFENNKSVESITVYVINDGIHYGNIQKLNQLAEYYERRIVYLDPKTILEDEATVSSFSYKGMRKNSHSYLKLLFRRMLKDSIISILYIDCDTVITGNLSPLFRIDMQDNVVGMCQDSLVIDSKTSIGLSVTDPYYNSGVILFNVVNWDQGSYEKKIVDYLRTNRNFGTVDQDVLNIVLKDIIYTLPIEYNLQPIYFDYSLELYNSVFKHRESYYSDYEITRALSNPIIIHFLRYLGQSPWNTNSLHPCTDLFDRYLSISPWRDFEKAPGNNSLIFRVERMMYRVLPKSLFLYIFYMYHEHMIVASNKQ